MHFTLIILALRLLVGFEDHPSLALREKHDFFATDNLGNHYLSRGPELIKFSAQGKRMARYSNLRLGDITSVDATNPLKILVYYRDFQQVVFLDNQLSPNGKPVPLQELGLEQAGLVAASANNAFWVYDKRNNELHRYSEQNRRIASTGNLKQVLSPEMVPSDMKEHNNLLYVNCPGAGIFVFDIFAAFSRVIPLRNVSEFQLNAEILYTHRGDSLCSFDKKTLEENCEPLPAPGVRSAQVAAGKRMYSYGDSLLVYPL